jgi:hypothetical protein
MSIAPIRIEIAAGELLDRLAILQIKSQRLTDRDKLPNVRRELAALLAVQEQSLKASPELDALAAQLKAVNERLWDIENAIRQGEASQDFGPRFVELARSVYHTNDLRSALKRQINQLVGSPLVEEKEYTSYGQSTTPAASRHDR